MVITESFCDSGYDLLSWVFLGAPIFLFFLSLPLAHWSSMYIDLPVYSLSNEYLASLSYKHKLCSMCFNKCT